MGFLTLLGFKRRQSQDVFYSRGGIILANVKVSQTILQELTKEDRAVLDAVYWHRCLDEPLICQYFYISANVDMGYAQKRIQYLVMNKLLKEAEYGADYPALFLTTLGVETVKVLGIQGKELKPVTKSAYDITMGPKNIPHQMALNKFVLEIGAQIGDSIGYRYYDGKFMPPTAESLMPDGVFEFCDHIVFLEMDMGTERSPHMAKKWNNYRVFLESRSGFYQGKDITMLFILENVKILSQRQRTVWSSIGRFLIDKIDGNFEVYADAPGTLQNVLLTKMRGVPTNLQTGMVHKRLITAHGFSISQALFGEITSFAFDGYIRKLTPAKKVMVQDGRPQEFLLDIWMDGRLSVLHKILYYHSIERRFKTHVARSVPYLVVVPDERWVNRILTLCDAQGTQNVFYTTMDRLGKSEFNEAVFQLDEQGTVHHFSNMGLKESVYEYRLKEHR